MKYTEKQLNTVKILAEHGATALYIANTIGVSKSTVNQGNVLGPIYKEHRQQARKDLMKSYFTRAKEGVSAAISIHLMKTLGLKEAEKMEVDIAGLSYGEQCELLDDGLFHGKISLNAYKTVSEVITRRFECVELDKRVSELESNFQVKE